MINWVKKRVAQAPNAWVKTHLRQMQAVKWLMWIITGLALVATLAYSWLFLVVAAIAGGIATAVTVLVRVVKRTLRALARGAGKVAEGAGGVVEVAAEVALEAFDV